VNDYDMISHTNTSNNPFKSGDDFEENSFNIKQSSNRQENNFITKELKNDFNDVKQNNNHKNMTKKGDLW
jgi:hypothetical protein